jgi:tRNA pseudouridine55 synthase
MAIPFVTDIKNADYLSGAMLLVDKPKGWTSFDVVNKVRGLIRHKYGIKKIKVGHSGTLDPMATGLLLICTGSWTKKLTELTGLDKKYVGEITFGIETDSYDAEGVIIEKKEVPFLDNEVIEKELIPFNGKFEQYPPIFSAIKKNGTPLYVLARAGKEVKTEPRNVEVFDLKINNFSSPKLELFIHCGSGFYVRSLAHDLGECIGCGAHLSGLVRTEISEYALKDAFSIEEIIAALSTTD